MLQLKPQIDSVKYKPNYNLTPKKKKNQYKRQQNSQHSYISLPQFAIFKFGFNSPYVRNCCKLFFGRPLLALF